MSTRHAVTADSRRASSCATVRQVGLPLHRSRRVVDDVNRAVLLGTTLAVGADPST
jgi:hypothetical protein